MNRKEGIIAFVDILGYSSFMENNDIGENTKKILQLISSLPKTEKEIELTSWEESNKDIRKRFESISILVVSDSILFTMPYSKDKKRNSRAVDWAIAFLFLNKLFKSFMDNGLPLRGAISCGEFITVENCFAGKPIILAYKEGQRLNCAGIILEVESLREVVRCVEKNKKLNSLFALKKFEYKTKSGDIENDYFLALVVNYSEEERLSLSDERELTIYLTQSFSAHNKTLDKGGKEKLKNTIEMYRQAFKFKK